MSEQTPSKQPTAPGDPASGVQGGGEALSSKQPTSNPYTVADYATGFMMGLEDRGWTRLDRELEDDIREQVDSLLEKLDVTGLEVRIGSLERALARVEGERDQQLRRVAELERERSGLKNMVAVARREREEARAERDFQQERAQVNVDLREKAAARIAELEREVEALREALTPSGATKAAYSGEVKTHGAHWDDYVSWSAIKDVMTLIRERAAAALGKEDDRG